MSSVASVNVGVQREPGSACARCGGSFYLADLGAGLVNGNATINGVSYGDICCRCWDELTVDFRMPCLLVSRHGILSNAAKRMVERHD